MREKSGTHLPAPATPTRLVTRIQIHRSNALNPTPRRDDLQNPNRKGKKKSSQIPEEWGGKEVVLTVTDLLLHRRCTPANLSEAGRQM